MKKLLLSLFLIASVSFAIPANYVWRIPSAGGPPSWGPVNLAATLDAVTGQLSAVSLPNVNSGVSNSGAYASFTTTSTMYVDATNFSVSLFTSGRPVTMLLSFFQTGGANAGIDLISAPDDSSQASYQFLADGVPICNGSFRSGATPSGVAEWGAPINCFTAVIGGSHLFKVQLAYIGNGGGSARISNGRLTVIEH